MMRDIGGFRGDLVLHGDEHPLWAVQRIADRRMARLGPIFAAMKGEWQGPVGPEQALRSVLLMTFFDLDDKERFCATVSETSEFQRFVDGDLPRATLDSDELSNALDRLRPNTQARDFVRDVLDTATAEGLSTDPRFSMSMLLVAEWTAAGAAASEGAAWTRV